MLYSLLKFPAKLAIKIYCKRLRIDKPDVLNYNGPLLLACNHPNSFLDAIILCTLFKKPIYSLARGDAFKKNWAANLLRQLNILPVYREREGAEHLQKNYRTFDACIDIFKHNGIVLIFSEALCINEWHLRPLKKGTARLAVTAWQQNIPLQILPIGINYSDFKSFGKHVIINTGEIIGKQNFAQSLQTDGILLNDITSNLQTQLSTLVYEIDANDEVKHSSIFSTPLSYIKKYLLFLPAIIGWIIHLPFYFPLKNFIYKKAKHTGHYDSIILGSCFLGYSFYLLFVSLLILAVTGYWWGFTSFLIFPLLALSWVQWKDDFPA
ncbi:MAG: 1-acyl-sn-glycerol-3-phosphate acyltransferase [Chitinophagaceae bacterium]|nr:1-acyl-sn-glycerol-3-phosphate acyltransferase [Chitinophagaceae bacterium]